MSYPPIPPTLGARPSAELPAPKVTSAAATASFVLSLVGLLCLPLIGGVAAILLGVVAIFDIRSSEGAKGGTGLAGVGIALGTITTIAWGGLMVAVMMIPKSSSPAPAAPPMVYLPPTATTPIPAPTTTSAVRPPQWSRDTRTIATTVGKVTIVDIGADAARLEVELKEQRAKAASEHQTLVLETTSTTCRPCLGVAASLADPKMQSALAGVRLVRVDVHDFSEDLRELGIPHDVIPGFFLLGASVEPSDGINGGEWDDDTAANIAPVLSAFVRGTLAERRQPWKRGRTTPRPVPTML